MEQAWRSEDNLCASQFPPPTVWILGIELRLLGLAAYAFTWLILLGLRYIFEGEKILIQHMW